MHIIGLSCMDAMFVLLEIQMKAVLYHILQKLSVEIYTF